MTLSTHSIDSTQLASITDTLTHDLGYAVLCQDPDDEYTVLKFAALIAPDDLDIPDEHPELLSATDLYGVLELYKVTEIGVGVFEVDRKVTTRQLPLPELDEKLTGALTAQSASGLWTPGPSNNYPLYELDHVAEERFQMA